MGSYDCLVYEKASTTRSITPMQPLSNTLKAPSLELISNISKTQSIHKALRTQTGNKKCQGDFCEYLLLKDDKVLEKGDNDHDEFISKLTLAFYSDLNAQNEKYKQEFGSSCVEKEYEKLRVSQLSNSIPFRYLLFGKELLSSKEKYTTLELTEKEIQKLHEPEYKYLDKPPNPLAHPSRMYDEAKVCDRCYQVYNIIRSLKTKHTSVKYLPRINRDIPKYFKINHTALKEAITEEDSKLIKQDSKTQFSMLYKLTVSDKSQNTEVHDKVFDGIASRMFPNDYTSSWGIKSQQEKNSES